MSDGSHPEVLVFPDIDALSHAAADRFVSLSRSAVLSRRSFATALSGGSTPRLLYSLLGTSPYREDVDWKHVHIFWTDERCVDPSHENSNFKLVADALLLNAVVPVENVHRIRGEAGPAIAAQEYEEELRRFFSASQRPVFDLVILGVGVDGHTASLFPGEKTLRERARNVVPVYREKPEVDRVSLTLPMVNRAAHILFLVAGKDKADIVSEVLTSDNRTHYPAGMVRPVDGELSWFIDQAAASKLRSS